MPRKTPAETRADLVRVIEKLCIHANIKPTDIPGITDENWEYFKTHTERNQSIVSRICHHFGCAGTTELITASNNPATLQSLELFSRKPKADAVFYPPLQHFLDSGLTIEEYTKIYPPREKELPSGPDKPLCNPTVEVYLESLRIVQEAAKKALREQEYGQKPKR